MNKVNRRQLRDKEKKKRRLADKIRRERGLAEGKRPWEMQWDQLKMERWGRR